MCKAFLVVIMGNANEFCHIAIYMPYWPFGYIAMVDCYWKCIQIMFSVLELTENIVWLFGKYLWLQFAIFLSLFSLNKIRKSSLSVAKSLISITDSICYLMWAISLIFGEITRCYYLKIRHINQSQLL